MSRREFREFILLMLSMWAISVAGSSIARSEVKVGKLPEIKSTELPKLEQKTTVCTCNGGTNRAGCLCLKAGIPCGCKSGHESVWILDDKGRATKKTGAYVDRRKTPMEQIALPKSHQPTGYWQKQCSGGVCRMVWVTQ